jgi:hypothetical protein
MGPTIYDVLQLNPGAAGSATVCRLEIGNPLRISIPTNNLAFSACTSGKRGQKKKKRKSDKHKNLGVNRQKAGMETG